MTSPTIEREELEQIPMRFWLVVEVEEDGQRFEKRLEVRLADFHDAALGSLLLDVVTL